MIGGHFSPSTIKDLRLKLKLSDLGDITHRVISFLEEMSSTVSNVVVR